MTYHFFGFSANRIKLVSIVVLSVLLVGGIYYWVKCTEIETETARKIKEGK